MDNFTTVEVMGFAEALATTVLNLKPDAYPHWLRTAGPCGLADTAIRARYAIVQTLGISAAGMSITNDPLQNDLLSNAYIRRVETMFDLAEAMDDVCARLVELDCDLAEGVPITRKREAIASKLWLIQEAYPQLSGMEGIDLEIICAMGYVADADYWRERGHMVNAMSCIASAMCFSQNAATTVAEIQARTAAPSLGGNGRWRARDPLKKWTTDTFAGRHKQTPFENVTEAVGNLLEDVIAKADEMNLKETEFSRNNADRAIAQWVKDFGFNPKGRKTKANPS